MVVLVFNYGGQYAHLIARRVRELGVRSDIVAPETTAALVKEIAPQAIILSGGPSSVYEPNAPSIDPAIFDLGIPIFGICYGHQLICKTLGGVVEAGKTREYCRVQVELLRSPLFDGISTPQQ